MDFLLRPPATRLHQANDNKFSYITPPLDGSLTVPELYDFHYSHNPDYPVFVYSEGSDVTYIRFREVVPAAYAAARFIGTAIGIDVDAGERLDTPVAILASSDTITYFTTLLGMLRAEITLFLISPRNSPAAVAHLLAKTSSSHILVGAEAALQDLAKAAIRELAGVKPPTICAMPTYKDIYGAGCTFIPLPPRRRDLSAKRIIVHSSGSTSFPKPVVWNDRSYLQVSIVPLLGDQNFLGEVFGCYGIAMFHGIGLNFIAWLASTGLIMATFPPAAPAVTPTPDTIWNAALITQPSWLFGAPVFFEGWSKDAAKIPFLKQRRGLVFGGAPLQKEAGDSLAREGCALYSLYGSTEVGAYCAMFIENPGMDWEYVSLNPQCALEFEALGDGTYEMIAVARPTTELTILNTTYKGEPAYATNDFLEPHPTLPNRWKVLGRIDDQIMLSTGEKTNPGPLEAILGQHPHVRAALMFGRGRFQNGVLIEVRNEFAFDPKDTQKLEEFRDLIWPHVEKMNAFAPAHSRLFREMIIVADSAKPFQYTPKGPPRRKPILDDYAQEIEAAYAYAGKGTRIELPTEWNSESSLEFARTIVRGILKGDIADHEDMFNRGCDSLQAARIRQNLQRSLGTELSSALSPNFVYEHPSISSLASAILSTETNSIASHDTSNSSVERVRAFLEPYVSDFPVKQAKKTHRKRNSVQRLSASFTKLNPLRLFGSKKGEDVVLITGTTGALGAATLAELEASHDVQKIYALNRPSSAKTLIERQEFALHSRGYDPRITHSSKVVMVEGELNKNGPDIDTALKEEIRRNVTHIIHIAWRVDFNLTLPSFKAAVDGVRGLVDFALSSPRMDTPKVVFASSVGIFRNEHEEKPFKEQPLDHPDICTGQGYAEGKWISEEILYAAAKQTSLRPTVVRIGQICGGTNGAWNTSEWLPALVKSSVTMGFLPELVGQCSWIPLDYAAATMSELRSADISTSTAHLVHPEPIACREVIQMLSNELDLPVRPYTEWIEALRSHFSEQAKPGSPDLSESIPAMKTLSFFEDVMSKGSEARDAMGIPALDVTQTLAASKTFRNSANAKKLTAADVRSWLEHWRSIQYL